MLVQSIPYPAGSGFSGAVARRDTAATIAILADHTYPIEQYDTDGYFTTAQNSRLTVPSDGVYCVYGQTFAFDGNFNRIQRNNSGFRGSGFVGSSGTVPAHGLVCGPIGSVAGDFFTLINSNASANQTPSHLNTPDLNWFQIEKFRAGVKYALVSNNADQALAANTFANAIWQTEISDVGGWFDAGVNNTRFVVPAGISLVRLRAGLVTSEGGAGPSILGLRKNGSTMKGLGRIGSNAAAKWMGMISAPIEVTEGDFFEVRALTTAAANVSNSNGSFFSIEEVLDTTQRVLVSRTTAQNITAGNQAAITWDSEEYKTNSAMHSNSVNPDRLIVPDGCTKARLILNVRNTSGTTFTFESATFKNNAEYGGKILNRTGSRERCSASAWVDVVPGDYFTVVIAAGSQNFSSDVDFTWACLECQ